MKGQIYLKQVEVVFHSESRFLGYWFFQAGQWPTLKPYITVFYCVMRPISAKDNRAERGTEPTMKWVIDSQHAGYQIDILC
jgi:hypothetical protein